MQLSSGIFACSFQFIATKLRISTVHNSNFRKSNRKKSKFEMRSYRRLFRNESLWIMQLKIFFVNSFARSGKKYDFILYQINWSKLSRCMPLHLWLKRNLRKCIPKFNQHAELVGTWYNFIEIFFRDGFNSNAKMQTKLLQCFSSSKFYSKTS